MRRFLKQLGLLLGMMLVGTLIDWAVHSMRVEFYVEPEYYWNKIIYGLVWGMIGFIALRKILDVRSPKALALGVPAVIAGILQTKYFYQGRDNFFVVLFLVLHYLMFLPGSWYIFHKFYDLFVSPEEVSAPKQPARGWLFVGCILVVELLFFLYFQFILDYQRF